MLKKFRIDTYVYAGTTHTTTIELGKEFDRETVRQHGTGHAKDGAFSHYDHSDGTREALEMREAYDRMRSKTVKKLKAVK